MGLEMVAQFGGNAYRPIGDGMVQMTHVSVSAVFPIFAPQMINKCGLLGLDAVLQINPQRNFAVFFGLPLHKPPFDALGDSFFGLSSGSSASRIFMKSDMLRALGVVTFGVPTR